LRRQMLLQRLDVTIRSFLWGEKGQGKEGEIVAAIMAQRDHLSEMPVKYTVIKIHVVTVAPLFLRYLSVAMIIIGRTTQIESF
jgi:hypothetical protein